MPAKQVNLYRLQQHENPVKEKEAEWAWMDRTVDWCSGIVVSAASEDEARKIAFTNSKDEPAFVWTDAELTECVKIGTAAKGLACGLVILQTLI